MYFYTKQSMVYQKDTAKQAASEARRPGTSRVSTTQQNSKRQAKQAASSSGGAKRIPAPAERSKASRHQPGVYHTAKQRAASEACSEQKTSPANSFLPGSAWGFRVLQGANEGSGFVLLRRDKVYFCTRPRERRQQGSKSTAIPAKKMEPAVGFEPTTW